MKFSGNKICIYVYFKYILNVYYLFNIYMVQRKKYANAINFYVTEGQKKKMEFILEQKWQNLTDFLRNHIQTTIEKYEDKNWAINIYQTYIS